MVGPTRKAGWHPLFLNRERVQDCYSDPISLVRESVIVSEQGLRSLGRPVPRQTSSAAKHGAQGG